MAHSHSHSDQNTYYMDQLCTLGTCAAMGAVAILLYTRGTLSYILDKSFFPYVLAGGVVLLVLVAIRAATLWRLIGEAKAKRQHDHQHHEHGEACGHDHHHEHAGACNHDHHHHEHKHGEACEHDHHHEHAGACNHDHHHHEHGEACGHDHDHDHAHGCSEPHVHGPACDHDHAWAPWRYAVILLPVVLFFLNMPNSPLNLAQLGIASDVGDVNVEKNASPLGFKLKPTQQGLEVESVKDNSPAQKANVKEGDVITKITLRADPKTGKSLKTMLDIDVTSDVDKMIQHLRGKPSSAVPPQPEVELTFAPRRWYQAPTKEKLKYEEVVMLGFKELEGHAQDPTRRQYFEGKIGTMKGQYAPGSNSFQLIRLKITCCAADVIPQKVIIVAPERPNFAPHAWIEVTGEIHFIENPNKREFTPVIRVTDMEKIRATDADPEAYQLN